MQPKNQNDGVRLSTRYQQYDFAKRHLGGFGGRKVFPIGGSNPKNLEQIIGGGQGNRVYDTNGISCTQAAQAGGQGAKTGLYANTLDANYYKGNSLSKKRHTDRTQVIRDNSIRRLTPIECERLMGLKDNWTAEGTEGKISDTQRYKMAGNGVVINVVEAIISRLIYNKQ